MEKTGSKTMVMIGLGLIAVTYLMNPGFGMVELMPDGLPIIGHVDEMAAAWILYSVLAYFGIKVPPFLFRRPPKNILR
jgi:hypothetical protein